MARLTLPKAGKNKRALDRANWVTLREGPEGGFTKRTMWAARAPSGVWLKEGAEAIQVFEAQDVESGVIEPGTYTLTVGCKHPDHPRGVLAEKVVVIKPGEVTQVEVDLDAAPPAPEPGAAAAVGAGCG